MSLRDHPGLNTAEAIARGPYGIQQEGTPDIQDGLQELKGAGLAEESGGTWRLASGGILQVNEG